MACVIVSGHAAAATIAEFTNLGTGRYLLAHDAQQAEALETGRAGPGWVRTGLGFHTPDDVPVSRPIIPDDDLPVSRFVRTQAGAPQHFFTLDAQEAASLARPGSDWTLEGFPFRAYAPDASGACPWHIGSGFFGTGGIPSFPVYRLFSGVLGAGHRFTMSEYEVARLIARGWRHEGIGFCVSGAYEMALESFTFQAPTSQEGIATAKQCADSSRPGPCLAVFNLPLPNQTLGPLNDQASDVLYRLTGMASRLLLAPIGSLSPVPPHLVVQTVFMGGADLSTSLHLDSRARGASPYASLATHYQFRTTRAAGAVEERFLPWASLEPETQLALRFHLHAATLSAEPGSHAYGHTTVEFQDRLSGRSFYFNVLAYADGPLGGDGTGFDVNMEKPIVGTSFGAASAFGRSVLAGPARSPGGIRPFDFRIDRGEFQRIVDAAREADPLLSGNPADYLVANFRLKNETVGDAEIGVVISAFSLARIARGAR